MLAELTAIFNKNVFKSYKCNNTKINQPLISSHLEISYPLHTEPPGILWSKADLKKCPRSQKQLSSVFADASGRKKGFLQR